jgi:hypothetical protein
LITKCFTTVSQNRIPAFKDYRKALLENKTQLRFTFGAGSKIFKSNKREIKIAKTAGITAETRGIIVSSL